ncbi:hypothetical protein [Vibrio stylophorae]|nr:hypothetical protein [Vibrio stylophorae]
MIEFIKSITEAEMHFISHLDYGCDSDKHYEELQKVIFEQNGITSDEQFWYPYEVIELGSYDLQDGHEREFAICVLLVIHNVVNGTDPSNDLESKFNGQAQALDRLPEQLRSIILSAYVEANI